MVANVVAVGLVLAFVGFLVKSAKKETAFVRDLRAFMEERGFTLAQRAPVVVVGDLRLEARFVWRGVLASGVEGYLFVGRGFGERISSTAQITSVGHFFYVWAVFPPTARCDDAWLQRWTGDARAVRQLNGDVVVYWQRDYGRAEVGDALDKLTESLA